MNICWQSSTFMKWAASWQNQQNDPPSLIKVFAVRSVGSWRPNISSYGQRRLWSDWAIRPGWSESSLGSVVILLVCHEAAQIRYLLIFVEYKRNCDRCAFLYLTSSVSLNSKRFGKTDDGQDLQDSASETHPLRACWDAFHLFSLWCKTTVKWIYSLASDQFWSSTVLKCNLH